MFMLQRGSGNGVFASVWTSDVERAVQDCSQRIGADLPNLWSVYLWRTDAITCYFGRWPMKRGDT